MRLPLGGKCSESEKMLVSKIERISNGKSPMNTSEKISSGDAKEKIGRSEFRQPRIVAHNLHTVSPQNGQILKRIKDTRRYPADSKDKRE